MIDPKLLRTQPELVADKLRKKKFVFDVAVYSQLEQSRKRLQTETESLQSKRNAGAKNIGQAKKSW